MISPRFPARVRRAALALGLGACLWTLGGVVAPAPADATDTRVVIISPGIEIRLGDGRSFRSHHGKGLRKELRSHQHEHRRFRTDRERDHKWRRGFDRKRDHRFDRKRSRYLDRRLERRIERKLERRHHRLLRRAHRLEDRPRFRTYRYKQYRFRRR